jgi:hypothetical protein
VAALGAIPDVAKAHRGWPKSFEQLPCIAVSEAGNAPADFRDDAEYMTELEYFIRVFAARAEQTDTISSAVEDAMLGLGYTRSFSWDDDSADVRQKALRYRKIL